MDIKKKFILADRNKPGIDRTVIKLLAILTCDRDKLQKEIDGFKEENDRIIHEQKYEDAGIKSKEKEALSFLNAIDSIDTIQEVYDVLEDCIFFEYAPKDVIELCKSIIDIRPVGKMPKDMDLYERKLMQAGGLAKIIFEFTPYKFFFLGGATVEHRTLFARDHKEAWTKANEYCIGSFSGNVRGIFCLTKDGKDVGTLKNLEAMFTPKDTNTFQSVKAVDLLPEYKDYE